MRSLILFMLTCGFVGGTVFEQPANARDIFVNNMTGNDRWLGFADRPSSAGTGPVRSIRRAVQIADGSDRIILAKTERPYKECVTLQGKKNSGFDSLPFLIVGNGAILDGSAPIPQGAWEPFKGDVFRYRPPRLSSLQLFIDSVPVTRRKADIPGVLPDLKPKEWALHEGMAYFRTEPTITPREYHIWESRLPMGLSIYQTDHVIIQDLVIQGFSIDGINVADSAFNTSLVGVVCRGNGRSGVNVAGSSRVYLEDCLVGNNGDAQLRTEGFCKVRAHRCELIPNTAPDIVRKGGKITITEPITEPPAATTEPQ